MKQNSQNSQFDKWRDLKYSRSERRKRVIAKQSEMCYTLDSFVTILNKMDLILKENYTLRQKLAGFLDNSRDNSIYDKNKNFTSTRASTSTLLEMLLKSAEKETLSKQNRYESKLKLFASYLFIIGGRSTYKTLQANLPLPAVTSVMRSIKDNGNHVIEGELNFTGLSNFLTKHNLPRCVWMSEDATGITGRIQYDPTTNQIIGFVLPVNKFGLPIVNSYPATTAEVIKEYFETKKASTLLYIIMMQPLQENAPPFCFSLYGTDNIFKTSDVIRRWNYIFDEAKKHNITILGTSSDGDPRLLRSMRYQLGLGKNLNHRKSGEKSTFTSFANYYAASFDTIAHVQDTVHIATKLRNRLLKTVEPQKHLILGEHKITLNDLLSFIETEPKSRHLLCKSDLNINDKMNYRTVEKIITNNVINLLKERKATSLAFYLEMIQNCVSAFTENSLSPTERIFKIWTAAFFFRAWRSIILRNKNYKLVNFITTNAYLCIEINAHSIINIIVNLREMKCPEFFLPTLFNSQTCENFFRITRSMTSTNCTMVNFSMLEVLHRLKRLQLQTDLSYSDELQEFTFPCKKDLKCQTLTRLPSNEEIGVSIEAAKAHVKQIFFTLGVKVTETDYLPKIEVINEIETKKTDNNDYNSDRDSDCDEPTCLSELSNNFDKESAFDTDSDSDWDLNLEALKKKILEKDSTAHTSFQKIDSHKIVVKDGTKNIMIKKSTFCWLLQKSRCHLSSDRQRRVMGK